jgi:hypothetical protein
MIVTTADIAARVSILHSIARRADERLTASDPACQPHTPAEHVAELVGSLGCVPFAETDEERTEYLADHAAIVLLWLEQIERDRRAA